MEASVSKGSCLASVCSSSPCCLRTGEQKSTLLHPTCQLITQFSSFYRLKLSICWLNRFKTYLLTKVQSKGLTRPPVVPFMVNEPSKAESNVIGYVERTCFSGDLTFVFEGRHLPGISLLHRLNPIVTDGLLRVGGRLDSAPLPYDIKHHIILPECHFLTEIIIRDAHERAVGHCGVNATLNVLCQRFWILNPKVAVRRVISTCVTCKRVHPRMQYQIMADLPLARFQISEPPFCHTGVDLFGPLTVKVKRSNVKLYGCLFTCVTTRAMHLELAYDLSTSSFIHFPRRFPSRRGSIKHLHSDNATNFVGSERVQCDSWNELQIRSFLRPQKIEWLFNNSTASHAGEIWEKMIRSVREILLAVMPKKTLTNDELHTVLLEIEAIIVNSRPLTDVPIEPSKNTLLMQNHLLRVDYDVAFLPFQTNEDDCYSC